MTSFNDEVNQMLSDCEQRSGKLTEWETNFIDSLQRQLETKFITPKQYEVLERIWERIT
jgi:hypothetical protein